MRELSIGSNQEGQRLDRFLGKYLKNASGSFIQKMIRKKNITVNGKKATGGDTLSAGDKVQIFFSEETFEKFCGTGSNVPRSADNQLSAPEKTPGRHSLSEQDLCLRNQVRVLYEGNDIIALHKPEGMLSQRMDQNADSLNDYLIDYCLEKGYVTEEELKIFKPSVANRLDRNTTGIVLCGRTLKGLQKIAELQKADKIEKYYLCIVKGLPAEQAKVKAWLRKDKENNKVEIIEKKTSKDALPIETWYERLSTNGAFSLMKIRLITGRTHQIRAQMAHLGHPVAGDNKYGDVTFNRMMRDHYKVKTQVLHCHEVRFTSDLTGTVRITDPLPTEYQKLCRQAGLE